MQASGPGPRKAQFLKGWFIYRHKKQLTGRRLGAPYREKSVNGPVFKFRDQGGVHKREDQEQAEYPKGPNPVSSFYERVDVHAVSIDGQK